MCRASCKKRDKSGARQQGMGEQSRISTWPDVNVLRTANNDVHIDHASEGVFSNGVWPRIQIGMASDTATKRCVMSNVVY
jgi:hypothetical protein